MAESLNCERQAFSPSHQRTAMLELRPTCENCNTPLPPDATDAMICSFECTFCRHCVEDILHNVARIAAEVFVPGHSPDQKLERCNYLGAYPASGIVKHRPVDLRLHIQFAESIKSIPPEQR
jgi:hypothetical protein